MSNNSIDSLDDFDIPRGKEFKFLLGLLYDLKKQNEEMRNEMINFNHPRPIMTISQVAEMFDVTERTIRNWMASGLIPYYQLGERGIRFKRKEVMRVLIRPSLNLFNPNHKMF